MKEVHVVLQRTIQRGRRGGRVDPPDPEISKRFGTQPGLYKKKIKEIKKELSRQISTLHHVSKYAWYITRILEI